MDDPAPALHASCTALRAAGTRLLERAQVAGTARRDMDGVDQFALVAGVAWLAGQPALRDRGDHLFDVVLDAVTRYWVTRRRVRGGPGRGRRRPRRCPPDPR